MNASSTYWSRALICMTVLLAFWALVGLGCGILFADTLNQFHLGGIPLGFWFAHQGAVIGFVLIVLFSCLWMNALDKKFLKENKANQ